VVEAGHDATAIGVAIRRQIEHGRYERSTLFGDGRAGERIAEILVVERPVIQKKLHPSPLPAELTPV